MHQRRHEQQLNFIGNAIVSILIANMLNPRSHIVQIITVTISLSQDKPKDLI
ncbi:hypothetical protein [Nostoc sp. FACHB-133]|uniref:hypothetical protein n=1 Tax=Nostoc sp. FACHB-133 TaxID=2692835 RepID=UPI001688C719|nr:hypothetical protein [Nostoc sp. FACHB-133]MBD2521942.1 hypothetical protein [Nostoc sp. FACHB-133]